jgi:CIC family chloride channel protein
LKIRFRFLLGLALVTTGAAIFAIAFRSSLTWLYRALYGAENVVDSIAKLPPWLRLVVPMFGALIAGTVARLRGARTQGVSNVMEAIALGNVRLSLRTTASRAASSWAAIAAGVSIGREGPLIEVGGALGAGLARLMKAPLNDTRVLVAAGTAAGFAAAYNTPLAAALFVLESIAGVAAPELLLPVMAATVGATAITRATVGAGPIYGQRAFGLQSNLDLISFAVFGVVAAAAAVLFKQVLALCERWFDEHPLPQPARALVGGLVVGIIAIWVPSVAGNGYEPLNRILDAPVASGIPGGIFTPMLLVGAAIGSAWATVLGLSNPGSYALVGMAATTAASIHAPLTAAVMIFELSGDYAIVLPLILTTVVSTSVSRALGTDSVYETELRKRGLGWDITLEGRRMQADDFPRDVS